ncbi:hypothetical protein BDR06DRAFT_954600 [Suillus hirtellus]|nr:hypothetical protein BDR06DRAFT_954600 [Suillus hirtellus]
MRTSNHALFSDLKLQNTNAKNESLRLFLGCQPDKVTVVDDGGDNYQFVASFVIEKFQKRLCTTRELNYEFVARGRIWRFSFNVGPKEKWVASCGLSWPSLPAYARSSLRLETHTKTGEPGRETPRKVHEDTNFMEMRVAKGKTGNADKKAKPTYWDSELSDQWVTYDNPNDLACDDTLHATLEITLEDTPPVMTGSP